MKVAITATTTPSAMVLPKVLRYRDEANSSCMGAREKFPRLIRQAEKAGLCPAGR